VGADNDICPLGATALAEALAVNTTMLDLELRSELHV
jgi:hypothetical protein